jgi:hypothetical protein
LSRQHLWAAAILLLAASPGMAAQPGAVETVRNIYRRLPRAGFDYREVRYTPALTRLLRRDVAEARGELSVIEAVPFCDCQDTANNYGFMVRGRPVSADRAE